MEPLQLLKACFLYIYHAADEEDRLHLGGVRIIVSQKIKVVFLRLGLTQRGDPDVSEITWTCFRHHFT